MPSVSSRMHTELLEVAPSASLQQAARAMTERRVGSALVTSEGRLVGILTERDILLAVADGVDTALARCREWMTTRLVTASPDTPLSEAFDLMLRGGFRHLPVVEGGTPVGIVSIRDAVRGSADVPVRLG